MRYALLVAAVAFGQTTFEGRPAVLLENATAIAAIDHRGGSIVRFELKDVALNPLRWANTGPANEARPMSHFLCLDRWGQPSEAERKNGMPFHGEATRVEWKVESSTGTSVTMSAALPMAGLTVRRTAVLRGAVLEVTEAVTNTRQLGRPYNMVQHPTIGPPFLDESTVVDSNARKGFMQSSPMPNPEEPAVWWPQALKDGQAVDMRRLRDDPAPNVVSYVVEEETGWATAVNAGRGLLLGYVWKTSDYAWFNAWRHVQDGKPLARGLEFGTTGLHQPFPVLIEKGRIFGRALVSYLDAGETHTRGYVMFLSKVAGGYDGVARVYHDGGQIVVVGRDRSELRINH